MKKRFTVYVEESDWRDIQDSAYWKKLSVGDYIVQFYRGQNCQAKSAKSAQPDKYESHKPKNQAQVEVKKEEAVKELMDSGFFKPMPKVGGKVKK